MTGAGALSGVSITIGTIALWFVACVVPPGGHADGVAQRAVADRGRNPSRGRAARLTPRNPDAYESEAQMSERNGDRARFQKDRKRKLRRRQRVRELIKALRTSPQTFIGPANATRGQS